MHKYAREKHARSINISLYCANYGKFHHLYVMDRSYAALKQVQECTRLALEVRLVEADVHARFQRGHDADVAREADKHLLLDASEHRLAARRRRRHCTYTDTVNSITLRA